MQRNAKIAGKVTFSTSCKAVQGNGRALAMTGYYTLVEDLSAFQVLLEPTEGKRVGNYAMSVGQLHGS
jgi:hypothetical protein